MEDKTETLNLMLQAIDAAIKDTTLPLSAIVCCCRPQTNCALPIDSIDIIAS